MNTIHKVSHKDKLHGQHLVNLQVDCGEIIKDVEILRTPLHKNPGVLEDQTVCDACASSNRYAAMKHRTYVRERLKQ